jgi:hypothetical protein
VVALAENYATFGEVTIFTQILKLLSIFMDKLFIEDKKAVVNINVLPPFLEVEVLRN